MEKSKLIPFVRKNLDVLFIGLNPAKGSSENKHYFSVNQAFWNQLYSSGLIISNIDKSIADNIVFGSTKINYNNYNYGITDLVTKLAESDSRKIKPTYEDCKLLENTIKTFKPRTAVLLHNKVLEKFLSYLGFNPPESNSGYIGELIDSCSTSFFNIAFPHGNTITSEMKIKRYRELKNFLINNAP